MSKYYSIKKAKRLNKPIMMKVGVKTFGVTFIFSYDNQVKNFSTYFRGSYDELIEWAKTYVDLFKAIAKDNVEINYDLWQSTLFE